MLKDIPFVSAKLSSPMPLKPRRIEAHSYTDSGLAVEATGSCQDYWIEPACKLLSKQPKQHKSHHHVNIELRLGPEAT